MLTTKLLKALTSLHKMIVKHFNFQYQYQEQFPYITKAEKTYDSGANWQYDQVPMR